jgi:hypothetical protein
MAWLPGIDSKRRYNMERKEDLKALAGGGKYLIQ